MHRISPVFALGLCAQVSEHPDPSEHLGTLADYEDLEDQIQDPPLEAEQPYCPILQTVTTPSGPRIDPHDPYGIQTLTLISNPRKPGWICDVGCLLSTSDCWVSSSLDCGDQLDTPTQFPKGKWGSSSTLYVCIQATLDSPIPLKETVSIITSNDLDNAVQYMVKGAD